MNAVCMKCGRNLSISHTTGFRLREVRCPGCSGRVHARTGRIWYAVHNGTLYRMTDYGYTGLLECVKNGEPIRDVLERLSDTGTLVKELFRSYVVSLDGCGPRQALDLLLRAHVTDCSKCIATGSSTCDRYRRLEVSAS